MLYVSFTCLPTRLENITQVFSCLQAQTKQPDKIIIHYPTQCLRLNMEYDVASLQEKINTSALCEKIYLNVTKDYGPITKIYPVLQLPFIQAADLIVVIDDDMYYNPWLLEHLYNDFVKAKAKEAVCVSGLVYPKILNSQCWCFNSGFSCELMEAAFGYMIRRDFFDDDLTAWVMTDATSYTEIQEKQFENAFLSDDYLISRYLDKRGIKKRVLQYTPELNKGNAIRLDMQMNNNNALCCLGSNLDKYVRAEAELCIKGLV